MRRWILESLFEPVDIASVVLFRITFGAIVLWELVRYWRGGIIEFFARHTFFFPYYGFEWVRPWPGDGMYVHFVLLALVTVFVAVGFLYRASAALFFFGFGYVFLLDQSLFLNHIYLLVLVGGALAFIPAHRAFSLDALLRPKLRSQTIPAWSLWLLRFHVALPYFFGGLSKINADWLRGEPMRIWLSGWEVPVIGPLLASEPAVYLFSYGGMLFDLLIVPGLLWRRTRALAFAAALGFHLFNAGFFHIGVFPWFMIVGSALFFEPDFPRRLLRAAGITSLRRQASPAPAPVAGASVRARGWLLAALGGYALIHVALPLRHHLYPGPQFWTGEGYYFGWHMRGAATLSTLRLFTEDPTNGRRRRLDYLRFVTKRQSNAMSARPWMVHYFSRVWADRVEKTTGVRMPVYAELSASLNGRKPELKIDPTVNLAEEPTRFGPAPWILPLREPLRPP